MADEPRKVIPLCANLTDWISVLDEVTLRVVPTNVTIGATILIGLGL